MPLGIVKDDDYIKELGEVKQTPNVPNEESPSKDSDEDSDSESNRDESTGLIVSANDSISGRGQGSTEVPQSIRKLIGESAIEEGAGAATAIGKFLGLSQSSISAYSKGATSTATYKSPNADLADHLDKARKKISKKAAGKLFKALNVIDEDKLGELSALEASTVAKNMSAIIKHMEPDTKSAGNTFNGPVITFYAPHLVQEEQFDVINVSE